MRRQVRHTLRSVLFLGTMVGSSLTISSCKDEIASPIYGKLEIQLASPTAAGFEGGQIWLDDSLLVSSVNRSAYDFVLPVGSAQLRYEKDCANVAPNPEITIEITPGSTRSVRWDVSPSDGGLEVTSSMRGAAIILDDLPTGRITPATLECLEPGEHTVQVELFGAGETAPKSVTVGSGVVSVDFPMEPLSQPRGAVLEVYTATNCPNCGPVDAAAESLWTQSDLVERGGFSIQFHTRWQADTPIEDTFHTGSTLARNVFYGDQEAQGIPWRVTNGLTSARGFPQGTTIPQLVTTMRNEIEPYLNGDHGPAQIALYWTESYRNPGQSVGGTLRVVMLEDPASPHTTEVLALDYKDRLVTFVLIHGRNETFYRVVRDVQSAGTLQDLGLVARGDWIDLELVFDISWDTAWTEEGMGLVAMVQNLESKEIYQAVHEPLQ